MLESLALALKVSRVNERLCAGNVAADAQRRIVATYERKFCPQMAIINTQRHCPICSPCASLCSRHCTPLGGKILQW